MPKQIRPLTRSTLFPAVLAVSVFSAGAAENPLLGPNKNRFSLGASFGLNIDASFSRIGRFPASGDIGGLGGGQNRTYDDGYVMVDSSGNAGGQTWFWGYQNADQVEGNSILMNSATAQPDASSRNVDSDPQYGVEFIYSRELGRIKSGRWGFETGLHFTDVSIDDDRAHSIEVSRTTDAYPFTPGTTPPAAPFEGDFNGPNFTIGDSPTRSITTLPGGASVTGKREFDGDVLGVRLGPFIEFPLGSRASLYVSGGALLAGIRSELRWRETVTVEGAGSRSAAASGSDQDVLVGGYAGLTVHYALNSNWSLFGRAQYQNLGTYDHRESGTEASIDFKTTAVFTVGAGWSF